MVYHGVYAFLFSFWPHLLLHIKGRDRLELFFLSDLLDLIG